MLINLQYTRDSEKKKAAGDDSSGLRRVLLPTVDNLRNFLLAIGSRIAGPSLLFRALKFSTHVRTSRDRQKGGNLTVRGNGGLGVVLGSRRVLPPPERIPFVIIDVPIPPLRTRHESYGAC